ncbi:MAG TPA: aldo/keto reductase [Chitinophagaceae bacterium]
MQYNQLGKSFLKISEIGFGTMSLVSEEKSVKNILHKAMDYGINYFDTADLYDKGLNEIMIGKALKGKRDKIVLATKAGNQWRPDGSGWDWNPKKKYILACFEKSLQRLQTDYIDLFQLHGGTIDDPIDETIEAFEQLKQQGKIRYYGISSIRPNVIREYVKRSSIISVMMQYSLLDRRPEEICLDFLQENNIAVLPRGTLAQGLLVNKPAKEYLGYTTKEVAKAAAAIQSVSGEHRTAAQTATRFAMQHPSVTSVIAGIRTMEQLEEIANTINTPSLTAQELQTLQQSVPPKKYEMHR